MTLTLEAKYALWANPLISQPPAQSDESVDALEPGDETDGADSGGGGGGEFGWTERHPASTHRRMATPSMTVLPPVEDAAAGDRASSEETGETGNNEEAEEGDQGEQPAQVPAGGQTFSNPNTHHHLTGSAHLTLDTSKKFSITADAGFGRDFVQLDDTVEVSPMYDELTAGLGAQHKLLPKLWLSAGYVFERRFFDDPAASGASQDFFVQGGKFG